MDLRIAHIGLLGGHSFAIKYLGDVGEDTIWGHGLDADGLSHAQATWLALSDHPARSCSIVPPVMESRTNQLRTVRSYHEHHLVTCACPIHQLLLACDDVPLVKTRLIVERTGASRSADQTNQTSSAAGSRR